MTATSPSSALAVLLAICNIHGAIGTLLTEAVQTRRPVSLKKCLSKAKQELNLAVLPPECHKDIQRFYCQKVQDAGSRTYSERQAGSCNGSTDLSGPDLRHTSYSPSKLGYVILSHRYPQNVKRLVMRLYEPEGSTFVVHVDSKSPAVFDELRTWRESEGMQDAMTVFTEFNVVRGGPAMLQAELRGIDMLLNSSLPWDFCILLSEQDYPLRGNQVLAEWLWLHRGASFISIDEGECERDVSFQCGSLVVSLSGGAQFPKVPGIDYGSGSQWSVLSRSLATEINASLHDASSLVGMIYRDLTAVKQPDESFFQTVVLNTHHCSLYADYTLHWTDKASMREVRSDTSEFNILSPGVLSTQADYLKLAEVRQQSLWAFFARKFDAGPGSAELRGHLDTDSSRRGARFWVPLRAPAAGRLVRALLCSLCEAAGIERRGRRAGEGLLWPQALRVRLAGGRGAPVAAGLRERLALAAAPGPLLALRVGCGWNASALAFDGDVSLVGASASGPHRCSGLWAVAYWRMARQPRSWQLVMVWVDPGGTPMQRAPITVTEHSVLLWHRYTATMPLPHGQWRIQVTTPDGRVLAQRAFFVYGEPEDVPWSAVREHFEVFPADDVAA